MSNSTQTEASAEIAGFHLFDTLIVTVVVVVGVLFLQVVGIILYYKDKLCCRKNVKDFESQTETSPIEITEVLSTARPPKKRNGSSDEDADTRTALLPKDGAERTTQPSYSTNVNDIQVHAEDKQ